MIRGWGGVTLAYRKRLQDSPAYRLNHEEVTKALEEGISVTENMNPLEAVPEPVEDASEGEEAQAEETVAKVDPSVEQRAQTRRSAFKVIDGGS